MPSRYSINVINKYKNNYLLRGIDCINKLSVVV